MFKVLKTVTNRFKDWKGNIHLQNLENSYNERVTPENVIWKNKDPNKNKGGVALHPQSASYSVYEI